MAHLALLDCVPEVAKNNPNYVGDHVIRHYRSLGLRALLNDLGIETNSITIVGGIGILIMYIDGREEWKPTIEEKFSRFADADLIVKRTNICNVCDVRQDGKCTVAGCACNGAGIPERRLSKCPLGKWP